MKQMEFFDSRELDVRWLDERTLLDFVIAGDKEAFFELMRRHDPRVRRSLSRVDAAEFWCSLLRDDMRALRGWLDRLAVEGTIRAVSRGTPSLSAQGRSQVSR